MTLLTSPFSVTAQLCIRCDADERVRVDAAMSADLLDVGWT